MDYYVLFSFDTNINFGCSKICLNPRQSPFNFFDSSADACNKPLGIADYRIRDDQMSASSAYDNDFATFGAHRARLNLKSWPPGYRANTETFVPFHWLKINMDHDTVITGIATQGYGNSSFNEWVTNYMVFYDKIGAEETVYCTEEDGETVKVSMYLDN